MDQQKIACFVENYARMSDDELSFLIVTRQDQLTTEAAHALKIVIEQRGATQFARELQASAADVDSQLQHEQAHSERRAANARWQRKAIRQFSGVMIAFGLAIVIVLQRDGGWWFAIAGAALFVHAEVSRLLRMLVVRLFRSN